MSDLRKAAQAALVVDGESGMVQTNKDSALRLAREALHEILDPTKSRLGPHDCGDFARWHGALEACRAALAQPEAQPMPWEQAVRSCITDKEMQDRILSGPNNATPEEAHAILSGPLTRPEQPTSDGWITSPDGLSRRLAAPDAAVGVPITGASTQTVQFQPTADGPTREDGQADNSPGPTTSDRGLPEPAYTYCVNFEDDEMQIKYRDGYTADQMLAFRAEGKAEGVAQERERCATLVETREAAGSSFRVRMVLADAIRKG